MDCECKGVLGWTVDVRVCCRVDCGCKGVFEGWTVDVKVC